MPYNLCTICILRFYSSKCILAYYLVIDNRLKENAYLLTLQVIPFAITRSLLIILSVSNRDCARTRRGLSNGKDTETDFFPGVFLSAQNTQQETRGNSTAGLYDARRFQDRRSVAIERKLKTR